MVLYISHRFWKSFYHGRRAYALVFCHIFLNRCSLICSIISLLCRFHLILGFFIDVVKYFILCAFIIFLPQPVPVLKWYCVSSLLPLYTSSGAPKNFAAGSSIPAFKMAACVQLTNRFYPMPVLWMRGAVPTIPCI